MTVGRKRLAALRESALGHPYMPLVLLFVAAVALRVFTMAVYSTAVSDYYTGDSGRYMRAFGLGMFDDGWQPAGYALFLGAVRAVTDDLSVTIAMQHVLGLVTGLLLYATVRRAGGPRALALIPTAIAWLSGEYLFLEHAVLTETLWTTLLVGGLYAGVRGGAGRDLRWLAAAGALLALSALVRNVSMVLPVVLAVWVVLATGGAAWARVRAAASVLAPAAAVVLVYAIVASSIGPYTGLGEMSGWSLYTRVGQFADCKKFDPPKGTAGLCESKPVGERSGPFYYFWALDSPARTALPGMSPAEDDEAGAFARAAILNQPLDYARTVTKDFIRYFHQKAGYDRPDSGSGPDDMVFRAPTPTTLPNTVFGDAVRTRYSGIDLTPAPASSFLETYQHVFRVPAIGLLALLLFTAIGIVRGTGYLRAVCVLCGLFGAVMLVLPPAVSSYDGRYSVPPELVLAVSSALAIAALARWPGDGTQPLEPAPADAAPEGPPEEARQPVGRSTLVRLARKSP